MKNTSKILSLLLASSTLAFANLDIKSIDIFTNKSFVNQQLNTDSKSVELLGKVRLEDIRFTLPQTCNINSTNIEYVDFTNDDTSLKIKKVKEQINFNENQINALQSNIKFLQNSSNNSIASAKSLKETSKFIKSEIQNDYNTIYKVQNSIKKLKEELNELNKKRANSKFTKLDYDISCLSKGAKSAKSVNIAYPVYNINRNGFYDINYNSKTKKLDIKNSSFITQSTGVDFKNIDINLYTYNFTRQVKPNKFYPKYLDIYEEAIMYAQEDMVMEAAPVKMMAKSVRKPSFKYVEDTTKSFFKASNITLESGKKTEVIFAKDTYKAKDSLEIDGYSSSQAFYKVDFKSNKLYGVLNSRLYLDGTYIGRAHQNEIKKGKDTTIYFATNRFIDVKKELIKDMKEEPIFSINKTKSQKIWQYKITNNHKEAQKVSLIERVPVSKHEDIKVKLIGKTKHTVLNKNGKIFFEFNLKPNETKTVEFGYEVEKPTKK